jgi:hypothetical protein
MEISRRKLLRGAGAALALPFLEAFCPSAAKPPLRLGIVTATGGTVSNSWRMKEPGPLSKLPSILRPLEFAKDDLLVLTGLAHHGTSTGVDGGHEWPSMIHLTGAPRVGRANGRVFATQSVDQAAADVLGKETYLPSLEIGCPHEILRYSFRRHDRQQPFEANPKTLLDRMFRSRRPVAPNWQRRSGAGPASVPKPDTDEQIVVDVVLEDARRLSRRLGSSDRHALESYLHSVESVERRILSLERVRREEELDRAAPGPSAPQLPERVNQDFQRRGLFTALNDVDFHGEYLRLMSDLMVLAFQTDTTRVATFAVGSDYLSFDGVVTVGFECFAHILEHQSSIDPIAREGCRQIHQWYTQIFADMVRKMKSIDEGGSSLLDNTLLLYTSYLAHGNHGRVDYPVLLAGRAQGTLRTGRQIDYPKGTPMSNLFVEMLDRVGAKADSFGESRTSEHAAFDGRLPGLV